MECRLIAKWHNMQHVSEIEYPNRILTVVVSVKSVEL